MLLLLLACHGEPAADDVGARAPELAPFPSVHWMDERGVALPDDLPKAATPFPVELVNGRPGFSPVQTAVIAWPEALDPASLPGIADVGVPGSVQLWDLDARAPVPCFAELDAFPDLDGELPRLLVRPQAPVPPGHRAAVLVTDALRTPAGPATAPDWFQVILDGGAPVGWEAQRAHYADLLAEVRGLTDAGLLLAFDWVVSDGRDRLLDVLDGLPTPSRWTLAPRASDGVPYTLAQYEGSFKTASWLVDDARFADPPARQGDADAYLFVHIPASLADAPPGSAPVWVLGHGIFSTPELYLTEPDDPSSVLQLADRAGAIVVATRWRGLTLPDAAVAVGVGLDFGTFPLLTDKLIQGVANTEALIQLVVDGDLLTDPIFRGLPDRETFRYYGISLGSIEGAVTLANTDRIEHAVLHVGGSTWSTMLERSSNWTPFEEFITTTIESPGDRQLLYSVSQLLWDPVDPALYGDALADRSILWQAAIGDDQVSNVTTWTLARAVGMKLVQPDVLQPYGVDVVASPAIGPALTQFDPELGDHDGDNRPSPKTLAHDTPRDWEGTILQTLRFLDRDDPGVVESYCGATACDAEHAGPAR
ncbi:MAG TPA: hypothetical protein PKA64_22600 [Myxococcota bacterium]|nr:hypothetical protein [Myxococcota bacterium]